LGGIPVRLTDTAGIRASADEAESIGVKKSYEALAEADLAVVVLDSSQPESAEDERLLALVKESSSIVVHNKSDLARRASSNGALRTSAVTGEGIDELRQAILRHIGGDTGTQHESGMLTNVRHQGLVRESLNGLEAAATAVKNSIPHEMLLLDLYSALR